MSKINIDDLIGISNESVYFTFGTAALNTKFVMECGVEFVALEWIVKVVSSRSKVNIIRKPFLSIAVMDGMAIIHTINRKTVLELVTLIWMIRLRTSTKQ